MNNSYQVNVNSKGAAIIEFAISSMLLFMFLVLGLDILRLGYHTSTLQYVLGKGAASGVIKASSARDAAGKIESPLVRRDLIANEIKNLGDLFGLNIITNNAPEEYIAVCNNLTQQCPKDISLQDPGGSKEFVRVDLHRNFLFIWGLVKIPIDIYVIVKNEPF